MPSHHRPTSPMVPDPVPAMPWWTAYTVDPHYGRRWQIGPSTLWVFHAAREWRLMHKQAPDPLMSESTVCGPIAEDAWSDVVASEIADDQITRFSIQHDDAHVTLQPALADRPIVARPEHAIYIPSGEDVTLYVSTPLWIQLQLGVAAKHEVPAYRPSDTWFGPSTREGELCYATRTTGRLQLDDVPLRPHRAVTPLLLQNRAEDQLLLERVQIPVHHLALFASSDHGLWTQAVTLHREEGTEGARVNIKPGPPPEIANPERVADPREGHKHNLVMSTFKAISSLFSS